MKRVHVVLSGLSMRLFICVHVCISCRYDWMFAFAIFMSLGVDVVCVGCQFYWRGVSDMYMLKSVGDSTPPCGTPFLNWLCVDLLFPNVVYTLQPLM